MLERRSARRLPGGVVAQKPAWRCASPLPATTALAFSTWAHALTRTSAGRLGGPTYAVPAVTVLFSWMWIADVPGRLALLDGAVCLAGVPASRLPGR
ncbi:hypothetical protein OTC26_021150 [Streptomyces tirandamycinicus]|uniref:hypothetical protein n=1 Tax=Streptomyces tirandamycinicus TaxID=2174846 RepID=UPI002D1E471C|nr:hypothetical protein [Streptomyces tirandamycinicus]